MKKSTKTISISIAAFVAVIITAIVIVLATGAGAEPTPTKTPVAVATETPAPIETPTAEPTDGEEVMGFDEYNEKFTESFTFTAGGSTVASVGEITKDCGAEPVAFDGATLSGYSVLFSDEAHTTAVEISCTFSSSGDALEDAGFEGLGD